MQYSIVDVFAEAPYQGNPLAVVRGAAALDAAAMQTIAREMNLSETTFVTAQSVERATVRIFTPHEELPFAGHPTLGTAFVLSKGARPFTLALPIGDVRVRFADDIAWMTPPAAGVGAAIPTSIAAELIGLHERDLDPEVEPCAMSCGPEYSLIAVRSLEALARVHVDARVLRARKTAGYPFTVCRGGYSSDADFAARMHFYDGAGVREDPATGSAAAAFAGVLRARGNTGSFIVEQGFAIGRPSRIYLKVGARNAVGGKVRCVAEGRLVS